MLASGDIDARPYGSIDGATILAARWGTALRARTSHVLTKSAPARASMAHSSLISAFWHQTLTAPQRAAWNTYATATPLTTKTGRTVTVNGYTIFFRCQKIRLSAGLALNASIPAGAATPPITIISAAVINSTQIALVFSPLDPWATDLNGRAVVTDLGPQSRTENLRRSQGRHAATISGVPVVGPTNPTIVTRPWPSTARAAATVCVQTIATTNRVSSPAYAIAPYTGP